MICYRCQTENETGAHFCKLCGADLWAAPVKRDDGARDTVMYLLILTGWEYFTYLVWMVASKLMSMDGFGRGIRRLSSIFSVIRWTTGGISLLLLILFAILTKNNIARICMIIFAVIRVLLMVVYR